MEATVSRPPQGLIWRDENPYYLGIADQTNDTGIRIDLGEPNWAKKYRAWMRKPGIWALMRKADDAPVLVMEVFAGEQPYYTARHVGVTGSAGGNEIVAYGIGKKHRRQVMRLWVMPNGAVCGGDDVNPLGVRFVKKLGPR